IPLHAAQLAEAAVACGHTRAAALAEATIREHAGRIALLATGHLCFGAVDRIRGDAARTQGCLDDAIDAYERAIDIEAAVGARIYATGPRLGRAWALVEGDEEGDGERVEVLVPWVERVAEELGTPMVGDAARRLLA